MDQSAHSSTRWVYHLMALLVACIWGSTFVASKILLNAGLSPAGIMCLRFMLAYLIMIPFWREHMIVANWKDELMFAALGITGGSLYFLAENTAVQLTSSTSTVALLVAAAPIMTAVVMRIFYPNEKISAHFLLGSFVSLLGTALVIFNGVFVLDDNPLVIVFSLGAALCWAFYGLLLRKMEARYNSVTITRKVFFWGIVTMLPYCFFVEGGLSLSLLGDRVVMMVLLYLAIFASFGCFWAWNAASNKLGVVAIGNYLYFPPITSLIAAYLVLDERITVFAIIGCLLVIGGVYLTQKSVNIEQ